MDFAQLACTLFSVATTQGKLLIRYRAYARRAKEKEGSGDGSKFGSACKKYMYMIAKL